MNNTVVSDELKQDCKVAIIEAGKIALEQQKKIEVKYKAKNQPVTNADIESERLIVESISKKYPNHSILTEEKLTQEKKSDYKWIIDPLDGTTNFVHNLPIFSISIGLMYKNTIISGVVYNPAVKKCFYATRGNGAFLPV